MQQRSVRSGIPLLDDVAAWASSRCPSLSRGDELAALVERDAEFTLMDSVGSPRQPVMSIIWTELATTTGTRLRHHGGTSEQPYVRDVLKDVIYELGLHHALGLIKEVGTFWRLSDAWAVVTWAGLPMGVVEVHNGHGGDGALADDRVAGALYDFMMRQHSYNRSAEAFGILTSYRKWRVCWLDNEATRRLAKAEVHVGVQHGAKLRQKTRADELSSFEAAPSKKSAAVHSLSFDGGSSGEVDPAEGHADGSNDNDGLTAEGAASDASARRLLCTRVYDTENSQDHHDLFRLLASAVWKMWNCQRDALSGPFDRLNERALLKFTRESHVWERLESVTPESVKWDRMPTARSNTLFAVEDLGYGSEGRCWLVCSKAGRVAVLKFFERDPEAAARREKVHWDNIYPQLGQLVKVEKWCGRWALVMPHSSQSVVRDQKALAAVEESLLIDYAGHGWMQPAAEVKWRNIGFYKLEDQLKAVVFDMSHAERIPRDVHDDVWAQQWARQCVEKLKKR